MASEAEEARQLRSLLDHLAKDHNVQGLSPITDDPSLRYFMSLQVVHRAKEYQHDLTTGHLHYKVSK